MNNTFAQNIAFVFVVFICGCSSPNDSAKVRESWFYLGRDGLSIGPSFEASVSASQEHGISEIKYENQKAKCNDYFYMSAGDSKTKAEKKSASPTTVNITIDNSKTAIDNSTNLQATTTSNTFTETTNLIDASSTMVDKKTINSDSSVTINSNNSNSKVNSENKKD